jgi:hypothetical protein
VNKDLRTNVLALVAGFSVGILVSRSLKGRERRSEIVEEGSWLKGILAGPPTDYLAVGLLLGSRAGRSSN